MRPACPNPECDRGGMYYDRSNNLRPSMWNGCCSPECGQFVSGLLHANPNHPAADQQRANADALDRWEEWVRAEVRSCSGHEWVDDPGRFYTRWSHDGEVTRLAGLQCAKCPARKSGDEMEATR